MNTLEVYTLQDKNDLCAILSRNDIKHEEVI